MQNYLVILSLVLFASIVPVVYGIEPIITEEFTHMHGLKQIGNYTFSITLLKELTLYEKLEENNIDTIRGEIGFGFASTQEEKLTKKFYKNIEVKPEDLPKTFYIDVSLNETGSYMSINHAIYFNLSHKGGNMFSGFKVVEKISKAINENWDCKRPELITLVKYDYSTAVCVTPNTANELIKRGYGI